MSSDLEKNTLWEAERAQADRAPWKKHLRGMQLKVQFRENFMRAPGGLKVPHILTWPIRLCLAIGIAALMLCFLADPEIIKKDWIDPFRQGSSFGEHQNSFMGASSLNGFGAGPPEPVPARRNWLSRLWCSQNSIDNEDYDAKYADDFTLAASPGQFPHAISAWDNELEYNDFKNPSALPYGDPTKSPANGLLPLLDQRRLCILHGLGIWERPGTGRKIYELIYVNGEYEDIVYLENHLSQVYDFVDYIVIAESSETFDGKLRSVTVYNSWATLYRFRDKIIYHALELETAGSSPAMTDKGLASARTINEIDCRRRPNLGDTVLVGYTENDGDDYVSAYSEGTMSLILLGAHDVSRQLEDLLLTMCVGERCTHDKHGDLLEYAVELVNIEDVDASNNDTIQYESMTEVDCGPRTKMGNTISILYTVTNTEASTPIYDPSQGPVSVVVGGSYGVQGLDELLLDMCIGEKRILNMTEIGRNYEFELVGIEKDDSFNAGIVYPGSKSRKPSPVERQAYAMNAMYTEVIPFLTGNLEISQGDIILVSNLTQVPKPAALDVLRNCAFGYDLNVFSHGEVFTPSGVIREGWSHVYATIFNYDNTILPQTLLNRASERIYVYVDIKDEIQPNLEPYCGSCYGADWFFDTRRLGCCNTCEELQRAYHQKEWYFNVDSGYDQCEIEKQAGKRLS